MAASEERSISEFPSAVAILATTLLFVSTVNGDTYDSEKTTAADLATAILGDFEYTTDLDTSIKTIFGAINSIMVLSGTTVPSSASGENGQLYVKYSSSGGTDTVDGLYWKINDDWVEISTGGGGGASVTLGTTVPSDASGSDGDLYVQYDGTSYAVIEYYVKINDSWRKTPYSRVVALTQAQYDLITPDNDTLYIITDEQGSYVKLPIITDAWDSSISYTVGMYCIHNDTLWKCTTANTNQEPVSGSTYWDDTSVADEIGRIDTALSGKQDKSWTSITIPTPTIDPNNPNKRIYTFSDLSATNEYCVQIRISNYGVFDIRITRVGQYFLYADDGFKWSAKVNIFASTNTIEVITNSNSYQPTSYPIVLDSLFTR